jgi:O-antigen/teichoic acid export membrane protein
VHLAVDSSHELKEGLALVTSGTLLVILGSACLVLFTFFSRVLLVRTPAADWNSISIELSLATVLVAFGGLGLPDAVARSLPHVASAADQRAVVRTALRATVAVAAGMAAALWLAAPWLSARLGIPNLTIGFEFFAIAVFVSMISGVLAGIFRGFADVVPNAVFVQMVAPGLFVAFVVFALRGGTVYAPGLTYRTALAAYVAANAVTLGALLVYAARRLPRLLPPGPSAPAASARLWRFAAPLYVAAVMLTVSGLGDTLVLSAFDSSQVGLYTATLTLARLLPIGITAAAYIFLPVATRFLRRENPQAVGLIYVTVTKWLLVFSIPLGLLFLVLPGRSLAFVYGPSYARIVVPLQLAVGGAFLATLLGPSYATVIAYGRVRQLAINASLATASDLGLALALVPRYGYVGAAFAWGFSTFLLAALCLAQLAARDGIHPFRRHVEVPFLATVLPMAAVLLLVRGRLTLWELPVAGLVAAGVFVLAVFLTKSVDDGDRLLLGAIERLLGRRVPFARRLARWTGNSR